MESFHDIYRSLSIVDRTPMPRNPCARFRARYEEIIREILEPEVDYLNIRCECVGRRWMVCHVSTNPGIEEQRLRARLDPDLETMSLQPFQVMDFSYLSGRYLPVRRMVVYTGPEDINCHVFAEIVVTRGDERVTVVNRLLDVPMRQTAVVRDESPDAFSILLQTPPEVIYVITQLQTVVNRMHLNPGPSFSLEAEQRGAMRDSERRQSQLRRMNSAPATVSESFHPENFMPIGLCRDSEGRGMCPIMHTDFKVHDVVYILKRDMGKVTANESVVCISLEGLMRLSRTPASQRNLGFTDPLRRTGERVLSVQVDFVAYVLISHEEDESSASEHSDSDQPGSSRSHSTMRSTRSEERVSTASFGYSPWETCVYVIIFFMLLHYFHLLTSSFLHQRHQEDEYHMFFEISSNEANI